MQNAAEEAEEAPDDTSRLLRENRQSYLRTFVTRYGDGRSPCTVENFETQVIQDVGRTQGGVRPGFTRYCDHFRPNNVENMFVEDKNDIPDDEGFWEHVPCDMQHPGLCATDDKDVLACAELCSKEFAG